MSMFAAFVAVLFTQDASNSLAGTQLQGIALTCSFTPEEEEQIRKENEWAEE